MVQMNCSVLIDGAPALVVDGMDALLFMQVSQITVAIYARSWNLLIKI
jgi:hypothetical protein